LVYLFPTSERVWACSTEKNSFFQRIHGSRYLEQHQKSYTSQNIEHRYWRGQSELKNFDLEAVTKSELWCSRVPGSPRSKTHANDPAKARSCALVGCQLQAVDGLGSCRACSLLGTPR
jgi:hypothetical protein